MPRPQFEDRRAHIRTVMGAVLEACDPAACIRRSLGDHPCTFARPAVIAIGKAAAAMYRGWCDSAGVPEHRILVIPAGMPGPPGAIPGDHPLPGDASIAAGLAIRGFISERSARRDCDGLALLLSGGASALVSSPVEGLPAGAYRAVIESLLKSGADITELNTVRKHAERLKGGRLAGLASPLPIDARILSDVLGDDPSVIASGPVSPDPSTYGDALAVLDRRGIAVSELREVLREGARGGRPETPKPGDPIFGGVRTRIVGNNGTALLAAAEALRRLGFTAVETVAGVTGESAEVGRRIAEEAIRLPALAARVWGGETTVTVGAGAGRGGRNQELALAAALVIAGHPSMAIAAFATDGVDGPTPAAGAIVDGETIPGAIARGVDPRGAVANHDSFGFFASLGGALLEPGPTGTNVNDLAVVLRY